MGWCLVVWCFTQMICAEMHVLLLFCVPKKVTKKGHQRSQLKRFSRTGHRHSCQNLISSHLRWIPTAPFPLKLLLAARSQLPGAILPHRTPNPQTADFAKEIGRSFPLNCQMPSSFASAESAFICGICVKANSQQLTANG